MSAPTLYFLEVKEHWSVNGTIFIISEQHMCQEKGCIKTEPEHLSICFSEEDAQNYIDEVEANLLEGIVDGVTWIKLPVIPRIESATDLDSNCGVYHNLTEMVLAICELSNLKPYEIVRPDGVFAGYTFEVVE